MVEQKTGSSLKFECLKCGTCCHEYDFADDASIKRIPVFPEELGNLEKYAMEHGIKVKFLEDVVFPDVKNEKILVITYKIILEGKEKCCPFFSTSGGCLVNTFKPLACKAYPIAQKKVDACHTSMDLDPYCKFIERNEDQVKKCSQQDLKSLFPAEILQSKLLMEKNQEIILILKQLTFLGKISIPDTISADHMNNYLQSWEREFLENFQF